MLKTLDNWGNNFIDGLSRHTGAAIVILLTLMALLIVALIVSVATWPLYARKNGCHPSGQTRTTYMMSGGVLVPMSEYEWRCDIGAPVVWRFESSIDGR